MSACSGAYSPKPLEMNFEVSPSKLLSAQSHHIALDSLHIEKLPLYLHVFSYAACSLLWCLLFGTPEKQNLGALSWGGARPRDGLFNLIGRGRGTFGARRC